jgi:hypothetical protein
VTLSELRRNRRQTGLRHFAENCPAPSEETEANRQAEKIYFEGLQSGVLISDMMRRETSPLKEREQLLTEGRLPLLVACPAL